MTVIKVEGKQIDLDNDGYLINPVDWDENVARAIAKREGVNPDRWTKEKIDILKFLREFYKEHKSFPIPSYVCRNIYQSSQCVVAHFLEPIKAWKIAGLPKTTIFSTC
jgi:TusE/DsrC/DsvC family sulfur relay protein